MKKNLFIGGSILALVIFGYVFLPFFTKKHLDEPLPPGMKETTDAIPLVGTKGHAASGTARLVRGNGETYIRYESLKITNGPDLHVSLSKNATGKEAIDLGVLKATEGNINYLVPNNIDLTEYHYALTWCKRFSTLFNSVDLLGNPV